MQGVAQAQRKLFLHQYIKGGQDNRDQDKSQEGRQRRHKNRLADKLKDEIGSTRAQYLAYAYLPGPFLAARRCQVHEIDTGDQQDDPGDGREQADILDTSTRLLAVYKIAAESPVVHAQQGKMRVGAC